MNSAKYEKTSFHIYNPGIDNKNKKTYTETVVCLNKDTKANTYI